ncbi:hypothetical protein ES703_86192 [subsurface metagenome]
MDISKAKKVVELEKDGRKILVTLYEGGQVSSCVEEETKKYCETCQCDDETCQEWINHLKGKGYQATEIELAELGLEESLPKFLEEREVRAHPVVETEENVHADIEAAETVLGSPGELQPGKSGAKEPSSVITNSLDKFLNYGSMPNDAALQIIATEVSKSGGDNG